MQIVNQPVRKKDAMQLVTGQPVYMDDMIPEDCLIVKLLRSPHANAVVQEIQTDKAMKVPGIEAIYTWKDIDQNGRRFTCAGQTYPEPSPYDRLILDRHVRFVGDPVAIVAGETEKAVDRAISMIKDAGLTYDGKSSDYSDSVSEGEVMNQSIGSGQSVEEGTSITLTVSLGSKVSSYTASISIENPFGAEIVDGNGNSDTYSEGQVTVVVYKPDGSSETVYDQYATEESLPGSVTTTSSSAGSGSVYA